MGRWKTEVRSDLGVFSELSDWWDSQKAAQEILCLNSKVLSGWEDGFDEPASRLATHLLYREGDLVAGLPLYRARGRFRSLSRALAEPFDVVAVDDDEVARYIPAWINGLPLTHLYRVREESVIVRALSSQPRWLIQTTFDSPYIDLLAGIEGVRANISRNLRKNLRRRRRRLEEMGSVTMVESQTGEEAKRLLRAGLELEARGWKGQGGHAVLRDESHQRWYRNLIEVADEKGWSRVSGLYLDDRLIAFSYDLVDRGIRHGVLSAYDETPDVENLSPGILLLEDILATSAAEGLESYSLGSGNDPWKLDWAQRSRRLYDLQLFGSGPEGRALHAAKRLRERARRPRSGRPVSGRSR